MHDRTGANLSISQIFNKLIIRLKTIALEFWLMILRYVGHIPIHTIRKAFYLLSGIKLPLSSTIHCGANFFNPSGIEIGEDTIVGNGAFLDGRAPLKIGNHTDIATDVMIYNDEHNINDSNFTNSFGPVTIGDYVFIGPRVIILPGITIGNGAIIAAGAVVTKNIPAFEVWGGIPAKKISDRQLKNPAYKLGRAMWFQ